MNRNLLFLVSVCLLPFALTGQTNFVVNNQLLQERDQHSAVPVGIADMNGDGLDDIITLDNGHVLYIQYQTPSPVRPFVRYEVSRNADIAEQNDMCIADYDNDGTNDIMICGSYDKVKMYYGNKNSYDHTLKTITNLSFFSQGASSGDFNQDGWVDVVLLNDNAANFTLINDGTGNLVKTDFFDFVTIPASDNSGNYGSVYSDFDMDGDLDLYIAKCRQGVNDPTDPRRINILFVNDGQGNYVQDANKYGLAIGHQTWTADFGDMDNDGDLDCFMTQHDVICELYENIDNDTFVNITPSTGINIEGVPLQGMFTDLDNDGYLDILVSGDRTEFYHNNGDRTFTKETPFNPFIFGTFALGDLNHDGFTDVYASRVIPFNNPDPANEDIFFQNLTNNNHFLALDLQGAPGTNQSAIGAMALLYGSWGTQIREVRGGEQYGVSNSHNLIFGLGDQTTYDSLVIRWPDKTRETFNGLETDQYWKLTQGGCQYKPVRMFDDLKVLCGQDSLILRKDSPYALKGWSNGQTSDSIIVKNSGL
ncbi:MAG TPA: CRTAC1 family protein, partial [Saprospiraceae bacterium]|nr:CRTAC1 family protein [Saprospiraceae bacterium]